MRDAQPGSRGRAQAAGKGGHCCVAFLLFMPTAAAAHLAGEVGAVRGSATKAAPRAANDLPGRASDEGGKAEGCGRSGGSAWGSDAPPPRCARRAAELAPSPSVANATTARARLPRAAACTRVAASASTTSVAACLAASVARAAASPAVAASAAADDPCSLCGSTGGSSEEAAVFPRISRINHSCCPNCHQEWNASLGMETVHAIQPIEPGDEVSEQHQRV